MIRRNKLLFLFLLVAMAASGQMTQFRYKRELQGVTSQWHRLVLPDSVFGKISNNLNDIRIYGVSPGQDTLEAPYLLRSGSVQPREKEVPFLLRNTTHNSNGWYFTFELPDAEVINHLQPEFEQKNFDWNIQLQGSHDQREWFTLLDRYRILSISNASTEFRFTRLNFPDASYRYYRLRVPSAEQPLLRSAKLLQRTAVTGTSKKYTVLQTRQEQNKTSRQTEITIDLPLSVPVSWLQVHVKDQVDYYRPLTITCLSDSFQTEQGWSYQYRSLATGVLSSGGSNQFSFPSTITKQLKLILHNQDNQPLTVDTVEVGGFVHELVVRFPQRENTRYFLAYGNETIPAPEYDLARFTTSIPETTTLLTTGPEETITRETVQKKAALFTNQWWLWAIICGVIVLLGWFTLSMMRKHGQK
jgi:hypothetical protein